MLWIYLGEIDSYGVFSHYVAIKIPILVYYFPVFFSTVFSIVIPFLFHYCPSMIPWIFNCLFFYFYYPCVFRLLPHNFATIIHSLLHDYPICVHDYSIIISWTVQFYKFIIPWVFLYCIFCSLHVGSLWVTLLFLMANAVFAPRTSSTSSFASVWSSSIGLILMALTPKRWRTVWLFVISDPAKWGFRIRDCGRSNWGMAEK